LEKRFVRYYVVITLLGLLAAVALWNYGSLALSAPSMAIGANPVVAVRGSIYDREGRLLAVDTDLYDLSGWRPSLDMRRIGLYSELMADALGGEPSLYLERLMEEDSDFFFLARRISGEAARTLGTALAERSLPGLRFDRVAGRVYPEKDLAAHLVGFVGTENKGLAGAEAAYEKELAADPQSARGGYAYGNSVFLTIDADLQFRLEELCGEAQSAHKAEAVVMVAMNARSGEVMAYVSLPDFNPNEFLAADRSTWLDRVAIYAYEPGSVFKVFTMGAVMTLGGIDEKSSFVCNGAYERVTNSGEQILIKCLGNHGVVNLSKILEYSCNSGAGQASDTVSALDFYAKLREFGFGERSGADLSGESPGLLRAPALWSARSKPTIAMGQEVLVTAIQMAAAATPLANGGILLRPRTLARIVDSGGAPVLNAEPIPVRRVLDERSAKAVLDAMEASVLDSGTGKRARIEDLRMSVKTGTAQMIDPLTRRYSDKDFIASTLALFPSEAPEYIVYAAIIKPMGESIYGGRIAAPLVRDAANIIADLYGTARSNAPSAIHDGRIVLPALGAAAIGERMPDLRGLPKRLLSPLLERRDIIVEIEGDGWVAEQYPLPGEPVAPGSTVRLILR